MIKHVFSVVFILIFLALPSYVSAHPGNTAADGCHYCRTNCAKWGEVEDARHCHGGGSVGGDTATTTQPAVYIAPVAETKPTLAPTIKPTLKPTITPSPTPTPSPSLVPSPTPSPLPSPTPGDNPEVAGVMDEAVEEQPAEPLKESNESNPALGLTVLGGAGAGAYMVFGKKKKSVEE